MLRKYDTATSARSVSQDEIISAFKASSCFAQVYDEYSDAELRRIHEQGESPNHPAADLVALVSQTTKSPPANLSAWPGILTVTLIPLWMTQTVTVKVAFETPEGAELGHFEEEVVISSMFSFFPTVYVGLLFGYENTQMMFQEVIADSAARMILKAREGGIVE